MHAIVIPVGTPRADALARRLAATGAAIVLVAPDNDAPAAEEAGRLAAELGAAGGRAAVFVGEDGLEDFLDELFRASGG